MARGEATPFEEFMAQMESFYPGLKEHRAKPHNDPKLCEACLSYFRRVHDRVRYLSKVLSHDRG